MGKYFPRGVGASVSFTDDNVLPFDVSPTACTLRRTPWDGNRETITGKKTWRCAFLPTFHLSRTGLTTASMASGANEERRLERFHGLEKLRSASLYLKILEEDGNEVDSRLKSRWRDQENSKMDAMPRPVEESLTMS